MAEMGQKEAALWRAHADRVVAEDAMNVAKREWQQKTIEFEAAQNLVNDAVSALLLEKQERGNIDPDYPNVIA